jgi:hypothetical protein
MTNPSWLRNLRAAAVLFHLSAVAVLSIPVPPPGLRGEKEDPFTEKQLAGWGDAVELVGIPRGVLFTVVKRVAAAEYAVLTSVRTPLRSYAKLVGSEQGWLMFGTVAEDVARLEILVQEGGRWSPLFVARSPDAAWRRPLFDQERMRTLVYNFGAKRSKSKWDALGTWVAAQVRAERPEATAIRVQMRSFHIPDVSVLAETGALEQKGTYWVLEKRLAP